MREGTLTLKRGGAPPQPHFSGRRSTHPPTSQPPHNNDAGTIKSAKSGFMRCDKMMSVATHTDVSSDGMGCLAI
jgi:hypothetical protein